MVALEANNDPTMMAFGIQVEAMRISFIQGCHMTVYVAVSTWIDFILVFAVYCYPTAECLNICTVSFFCQSINH